MAEDLQTILGNAESILLDIKSTTRILVINEAESGNTFQFLDISTIPHVIFIQNMYKNIKFNQDVQYTIPVFLDYNSGINPNVYCKAGNGIASIYQMIHKSDNFILQSIVDKNYKELDSILRKECRMMFDGPLIYNDRPAVKYIGVKNAMLYKHIVELLESQISFIGIDYSCYIAGVIIKSHTYEESLLYRDSVVILYL